MNLGHRQLVIEAAEVTAARLEIPTKLITLHRDLQDAKMPDGSSIQRAKQHSLRWGIFLLVYGQAEGFFNEILGFRYECRTLPLNPDKIARQAAERHSVKLFAQDWGVRTRTLRGLRGGRSDWETYIGTERVRIYLADMKSLRDLLAHGDDPNMATNNSGALWVLKEKRDPRAGDDHSNRKVSMRLMGVEGFVQATTDLIAQTILAYGGTLEDVPDWPEPARSKLSAEDRPPLPLMP